MFSLLESKAEISKAQRKLQATLKREFLRTAIKNIGYPGGTNSDARVSTDGRHWFWSADHNDANVPNPRRLNWFGLFKEGATLHISVEVNTTYEGRNDQVAGFFARQRQRGNLLVALGASWGREERGWHGSAPRMERLAPNQCYRLIWRR
jgi:hypothetical protein